MHKSKRATMVAGLSAGLLMAVAGPAQASVNIPEGGAVTPGSTFVIHFQVQEGCDGLATDTVEVAIPESISSPVPEDVPGWTEVLALEDTEDGEPRIVSIAWTGGTLQDGLYFEFGLRAGFPDDPGGTVDFEITQRCGDVTKDSVASVALVPRFGPRDLLELVERLDVVEADLGELAERGTGLDEFATDEDAEEAEG
jgi:uncharacterized protein YcnI